MYVNGVTPPTPPQSVEPVTTIIHDGGPAVLPPTGDVVEISTVAKLAAQVHTVPEVRVDLVTRVRSEIEAGTYETQERIDLTVDRLMGEFFG
ncbi:MAG: flagellar biosynthesis anti-sigma factor FlgM [Phycisphaerae bacterium]|nr:flagellar biosynthesis anti-sigma factor FlgM [Phycisphaerae bacterium]